MSTLFLQLPSFATDYSGFLSVMHGLGGLMVVHDPSGCLGNYTNCDEPRWYHQPQRVFSSIFREMEAVLGDYDETVSKICDEIHRQKPPFTCILGTPVPALTGCDVVSLAEWAEQETGVPCYGIETDGFKFYNDGIKRALDLLYQSFMQKDVPQKSHTVNIIGMTPLDYPTGDISAVTEAIETAGWRVGARLGMGDDLASVRLALSAEKNIVMNASALPLAYVMEQDGIPFWMGPPCGKSGTEELLCFLNGKAYQEPARPASVPQRILIIGEQACANAYRKMLERERGCQNIVVGSFFGLNKELMRSGDQTFSSEMALREYLHAEKYDVVIGDPLFQALCPNTVKYHAVPHPAVSSKVHWKDTPSLIGDMSIENITFLEV